MKRVTKVGEDIQDKREAKVIEDYQVTLDSMGLQVKNQRITTVFSVMSMKCYANGIGYEGKHGTKGEKGIPGKRMQRVVERVC